MLYNKDGTGTSYTPDIMHKEKEFTLDVLTFLAQGVIDKHRALILAKPQVTIN